MFALFNIRTITYAVGGGSSIDFSVFSQNRAASRNLNHYKRRKMGTKIFLTIIGIIVLNLLFLYKFNSPQVKRNLATSKTKLDTVKPPISGQLE